MFAFKKAQRLLKKIEYERVFQQAKKSVSTDFIILYCKNDLGHARLGLILSKKKIAKAHDRNRIKRVVREHFRQTQLPAVDIIFLAKDGIATQKNSDINAKLSKVWNNLIP